MTTPTLDDTRIQAMRTTVMHAVDADVARRGTRMRRTIGLAAASVLVVGFGSYGLARTGSNTASNDSAASSADSAGSAAADGKVSLTAKPAKPPAYKPIPPISKEPAARQVVVTGSVNLTVKDPRAVAQRLSAYVESIGGRVDERTQNNDSGGGSAFLKVRVPSAAVTSTIAHLKTYGAVEDVSLQNDDVTSRTADLGARIKALQLSIGRLEQIMRDAATSAELIKAESALTARQSELDSLQTQLTNLHGQVQLSTLSIDISQKPKADAAEPGGFHDGLVDGWNGLVATVNHLVKLIGVLLPWAGVAAVLYGGFVLLRRRRRSS